MIVQDLRASVAFFRAQLESWPLPGLVPVLARLLAAGEPVTAQQAAEAGGWSADQVREALARHPGVDWAEDGRILGFGLTLRPTAHAFTFADTGSRVYVFCASDALELPVLLGRAGTAESTCPATGQRIRVRVDEHAVLDLDPPGAVVSLVRPTSAARDIRAEVCGLGHFFASKQAGAAWLTANRDGRLVPVADDFEISRQTMIEIGWAHTAYQAR